MRIIAGEHRGRQLLAPATDKTRPITDRAKQSVFDILSPIIEGAAVYDCFAGTGSMGLECLSRGARKATFFEMDRSAIKLLNTNIGALKLGGKSTVIQGDLFAWFRSDRKAGEKVELIFLDPPYRLLREQPAELLRLATVFAERELADGDTATVGIERLELARTAIGDSIAVAGVCLTVMAFEPGAFSADVSRETLEKTTLGQLELGARVNLEPALRLGDPLGGHMVSGHVDGLARLVSSTSDARSWRLRFELPHALARFVAPKGSICLDGVSLTVNEAADAQFGVNIIPHTHEVTTLGALQPGDAVNVEIDLIARYLDRLVHPAA